MSKTNPKQACINCHFFIQHVERHPFEINQQMRDSIRVRDYSSLDNSSLACHRAVWDEGYVFDTTRRHEVIVETDRTGLCFYFPYSPGMLLPAAESLQKRQADDRGALRDRRFTDVSSIMLEPEQEELLSQLVEAARSIPRDKRRKFVVRNAYGSQPITNRALPDLNIPAYSGDIEILAKEGLILLDQSPNTGGAYLFDVTPLGFSYCAWVKQRTAQPVEAIEIEIRRYLDADHFQQKYPMAYQKWADADSKLWDSESEQQFTTIGHLCREAMQEFAAALVEQYQPPEVDKDKAHDVARVKAVLNQRANQLGKKEKPFLDALLVYCGTVSDLVQRQEHGAQKEGEPLIWEDGRRVVFQTAVVIFEIDKALSRTH